MPEADEPTQPRPSIPEGAPARKLTVLVAAKLHKNQLERHLELLERLDSVARILVVRHEPLDQRLGKLENFDFPEGPLPASAWRLVRRVGEVIEREHVDWVVGFNPVPWGSLAAGVARRRGVSTCLSLIGRDYLQLQKPWAAPFLRAVRKADHVTVTGETMKAGLVRWGVGANRISVLPHSVDIERFRPREVHQRFDIVSVGQLIPRKRMDVLIEATRLLRERGRIARVGILGKGPEEARLRRQIADAGLTDQVELLPYRDDVENLLAEARVFCLVSEWEGVPFALMEAMASCLVPVITDVGTIGDWVEDGVNGRIVPVGDAGALADTLGSLLTPDSTEVDRLRERLFSERSRLDFARGVEVWRRILETNRTPM